MDIKKVIAITAEQIDRVNLVAYWKLSGPPATSTTVFDYSYNGNTGTISGALPSYPGFLFDGADDKIDCSNDSSMQDIFAGGGTATWWQRSDGRGENNLGYVIGKSNWYVGMITNATTMLIKQVFTGGDDGQWTFPITATVWQHIAVVYDNDLGANTPVVYVNGASVTVSDGATQPGSDTDTSDGAGAFIIGNVSAGSRTWDGLVGDVLLYSSTKTAAQMKALYDQTRSRYGV
jgi:hypothetical protein